MARKVVASGADSARAAVLTARIDAAKMPIYLVVLYRWHELRNFTIVTRQDWPLKETSLEDAYAEYKHVFDALHMSFGHGAGNSCCDPQSAFHKLIFNRTKTIATRSFYM